MSSDTIVNTLWRYRRETDVSRRQVKHFTKCSKNKRIIEFHEYIWNHVLKCFQISTNMPSIDLVISDAAFKVLEFVRKCCCFQG